MPSYQYRKLKDGRKVRVTVPHYSDYDIPPSVIAGGQDTDFGVGPGAPAGELWGKSITTGDWYAVYITGSNVFPSNLTMSVLQSVLSWQSTDLGYQMVVADNGQSYFVFVSGSITSASVFVSQSSAGTSSLGKNPLVLKSVTDGNYYGVTLTSGSAGVSYVIGPNIYASGSWVGYY